MENSWNSIFKKGVWYFKSKGSLGNSCVKLRSNYPGPWNPCWNTVRVESSWERVIVGRELLVGMLLAAGWTFCSAMLWDPSPPYYLFCPINLFTKKSSVWLASFLGNNRRKACLLQSWIRKKHTYVAIALNLLVDLNCHSIYWIQYILNIYIINIYIHICDYSSFLVLVYHEITDGPWVYHEWCLSTDPRVSTKYSQRRPNTNMNKWMNKEYLMPEN